MATGTDVDPAGDARQRVLAAAARSFVERGYSDTDPVELADEVGLDHDRLLRLVGSKAELLWLAARQVTMGPGGTLSQQLEALAMGDMPDVDDRLDAFVARISELQPRLAPMVPAINEGSAIDPEASAMRQGSDLQRLALLRRLVVLFARDGQPEPDAADLVHVQMMTEQYIGFVRIGWTPERYAAWLRTTVDRAVNGDRAAPPRVAR